MKKHLKAIGAVVAAVLLVSAVTVTVSAAGPRGRLGDEGGTLPTERQGHGFAPRDGMPARGARGPNLEGLAEALGITVDELQEQLDGGRTMAEVAQEGGVDLEAALAQARQEKMSERFDREGSVREGRVSEPRGGMTARGAMRPNLECTADALGLTVEQLQAKLDDGMTVAEVADELGVDLEAALEAARQAQQIECIDQAVEDGTMSEEQAEWLLEGLDKGYLGRGGMMSPGGPFGGGGMRRPGGFGGFPNRAPAPAPDASDA